MKRPPWFRVALFECCWAVGLRLVVCVRFWEHTLEIFRPDGTKALQLGRGEGPGQFEHPTAVTLSLQDQIYVCDMGNYRVQVLNRNGRCLRVWGSPRFRPLAIAVIERLVFVLNADNQLQTFDDMGQLLRALPLLSPLGICSLDNSLFVWDRTGGVNTTKLFALAPDGTLLRESTLRSTKDSMALLTSTVGELLCHGYGWCKVLTPDFTFIRIAKDPDDEVFGVSGQVGVQYKSDVPPIVGIAACIF